MSTWRVWCPVCRRHRTTTIPDTAATATAVAAYDAHLRQMHKGERWDHRGEPGDRSA